MVKDGSEYWVEFKDGRIVFSDGRTSRGEDEVVHLPPCTPTKIICVHVNYISRYYEFNNSRTPPKSPTYFQKPLTALNAHKGELIKPKGYKYVNYEGEMAVVFGKVTRNVVGRGGHGTASRASRHPTTSAATTSATPMPARCCG